MNFYDLHDEVADDYANGFFDDLNTGDRIYGDLIERLAKFHHVSWSMINFLAISLIDYDDDALYKRTIEDVQKMLADGYFEDHCFWDAADDLFEKYGTSAINSKVIEAIVKAEE